MPSFLQSTEIIAGRTGDRVNAPMRVRPFKDSDADALAEIFFAAVHEIASAYYSREQIEAWAPAVPSSDRFRNRLRDDRTLLVAVDDEDWPLAYGNFEPDGHIDHFFCRPGYSRKGIAAALYLELEQAALRAGLSKLYVEASEPARRFFEKQCYVVLERNDFELNGVPIHNWRMAKDL